MSTAAEGGAIRRAGHEPRYDLAQLPDRKSVV